MPVAVTREELDYEVRYLEGILGKFIVSTDMTIKSLSREMKEFKEEMKEFKEEMKEFKEEMKEFKKTTEFTITSLSKEMSDFKKEMQESKRELNKMWGDLANKLGTFAEDIAAPNIPRIAKESFGCSEILYHAVRIYVKNPNVEYGISEFDAITVCENKVFLLETKSTIRMKYIEKLPDLIEQFIYCFPQYKGMQLIPVFGSMNVPENIVKSLSKLGFYVMVMGDDNMDIINFDQVKKVIKL